MHDTTMNTLIALGVGMVVGFVFAILGMLLGHVQRSGRDG